jgi:hypothetical protein
MRLLGLNTHGEFSLTEFVGNDIPQYAILSHTWRAGGEEVTFKDLVEGTGMDKAGYGKIRFCGEQAASDGLQYFWVDTCCIDKSNSVELSEAINSMLRWYRNASKCYVYLSDVSISDTDENDPASRVMWELAFRKSRWFTRGWTLQELIAPVSVEFFSLECKRLGDKKSLERQVHEITGIPIEAFQGSPLSHFAVSERMSWAENRKTQREEDSAYSLMGIFDIYMSPIYGEGRKNAFIRLQEKIDKRSKDDQCLRDLFVTDPHEDKDRIEKDKDTLLSDCYAWILRDPSFQRWRMSNESKLLWIKGDPGKGKTMIMIGLVNELSGNWRTERSPQSDLHTQTMAASEPELVSFFFCQSIRPELNNATAVLRGLIYLLVRQKEELMRHVRKKYEAAGRKMFDGPEAIYALKGLLSDIAHDSELPRTLLLVDALDECNTGLPNLLDSINSLQQVSKVKWLVTSRNLPNIERDLGGDSTAIEASYRHAKAEV